MKKFFYAVVLYLSIALTTQAQNPIELPQVTHTYAFTNINIVQSPGHKIDNATLVIKDGLITGVGKNISIPHEAIIIKADSMYAYAGFIDGLSQVGVGTRHDGPAEKITDPGRPPAVVAGMMPYADVRSMLNPDDKGIEQLRNLGFTTAQVVPNGNFLPGQSAIILLSGKSADDIVLKNKTALYADLIGTRGIYPSTVMGIMAKWRELYRQATFARAYDQMYTSNPAGIARPDANRVLEAFYPVIDQRMPVLFKSEKLMDIQHVMALKSDLGFSLVMANVKEGWPLLTKVKASGAKVFLSLDLPEERKISANRDLKTFEEMENADLEKRKADAVAKCNAQASAFQKAGIAFGFCSYSASIKNIVPNLRRMIAAGLSEDDALAALTTTPAKFLGLSDQMGSIDNGKIANLVITDKSYFRENSKVNYVVVDGNIYPVEISKGPVKIVGGWTLAIQAPHGVIKDKLNIRKTENGYVGTYFSELAQSSVDLKEVRLTGNRLSFKYVMSNNADAPEMTVDVVVSDRNFKGVINGSRYKNMVIEGTRDSKN